MPTADRIGLHELCCPGGEALLQGIIRRIERGAVFVYPTETLYGIGGRYDRSDVYKRICAAKGRDERRKMILLAAERSAFASLNLSFPDIAEYLASAIWPGPLTMVLTSGSGEIAVRVSDHPFITGLGRFFGIPLFSTSANLSGYDYSSDPGVIYRTFSSRVDFMVDAGVLPYSDPSTVIRVSPAGEVTLLREGRAAKEIMLMVSEFRDRCPDVPGNAEITSDPDRTIDLQ